MDVRAADLFLCLKAIPGVSDIQTNHDGKPLTAFRYKGCRYKLDYVDRNWPDIVRADHRLSRMMSWIKDFFWPRRSAPKLTNSRYLTSELSRSLATLISIRSKFPSDDASSSVITPQTVHRLEHKNADLERQLAAAKAKASEMAVEWNTALANIANPLDAIKSRNEDPDKEKKNLEREVTAARAETIDVASKKDARIRYLEVQLQLAIKENEAHVEEHCKMHMWRQRGLAVAGEYRAALKNAGTEAASRMRLFPDRRLRTHNSGAIG